MNEQAKPKQGWLTALANPTRFMALSARLLPIFWVLAVVLSLGGLLWAWNAPFDYQQGETVRIMYIHVPAAWLSMFGYSIMTISALGSLIWRHPLADVSIRAAAPIGAAFTLLCLVTGSLWGKPMWGTWWVWDARLTSVFVLMLMYLGLIALASAMEDPVKAARPIAILVIIGSINLPIIKYSVEWWNTLHQPASVMRMDGPTIHSSMLWPLLVTAIGFSFLFLAMHLMAMRNEVRARRIATMRRMQARGTSAAPATAVLEDA